MTRRMVFDVESIGLHGEAWAVGFVVLDGDKFISEAWACCPPDESFGTDEGREWVKENCPWAESATALGVKYGLPQPRFRRTPRDIRNWFWGQWRQEKELHDTTLWADVPWPVEARFLVACVEDLRANQDYVSGEPLRPYQVHPSSRGWEGPYPLLDVNSYVQALVTAGPSEADVISACEGTDMWRPGEDLPHHPLCDARVSATKILAVDKLLRRSRDEG